MNATTTIARASMFTIATMLRQIVKDGAPLEQVKATGKALAEAHGYEFKQGEFVCSIISQSCTIILDITDYGTPTVEFWN